MRPSLLGAAALLMSISGLTAQVAVQPSRDTPPARTAPPTGTASISGTVTVTGTGDPARRARVSLSEMPVNASGLVTRVSRSATTDDQGRFVFPGLPAGRFTLSASKPGHVTVSYGQRQPGAGRPGTPIQLAADEQFVAHLMLPRGGVVTGTVLDEHGEATPGTNVRALRYVFQNGARTLQQAGMGSTDDRGVFRIYGLQPGDYVVCAVPRGTPFAVTSAGQLEIGMAIERASAQAGAAQAEVAERFAALQAAGLGVTSPDQEQRTTYANVCYPGTTQPASAVSIPLAPGQERSGIDFQLQLVPVATVEGVIVSPAGASQAVQVSLVPSAPGVPGVGSTSTRAGSDGRFRLTNVAPGHYRLTARGMMSAEGRGEAGRGRGSPPNAPRLWAAADIAVDGRDVTDIALALNPPLAVSGHLVFDGGTPPGDLTRIRVTLSPAPGPHGPEPGATSASTTVDASGRFVIGNVLPGHYRLTAAGAAGWWVDSAAIDGQDALDFPFEVRPGGNLAGALVTMIDRQTEITGVLSDGRGAPVPDYTLIVFPADTRYWSGGARRIQSTRPGTDGRFTFRNLPAGEYRIATVLDPEPGSWTDPGYLRELEAVSLRVSLTAGEKKTQNIRLAGSS